MAPEQLRSAPVDRRTDVFAAGIVLWEAVTLKRLFHGDSEGEIMQRVLDCIVARPSSLVPGIPTALDDVTRIALQRNPVERFATAKEMALALEAAVPMASPSTVSAWVEELAGDALAERSRVIAQIESDSPRTSETMPASDTDPTGDAPSEGESSQASAAPPQRRSRWRIVAFGALALAVAGVLTFAFLHADPPEHLKPVAPPAAAPEAPPEPKLEPKPEPKPVAPPISEEPAAPTPPPPTPSAPARESTRPRPKPPAPARPKQCKIKAYVDDSGIKHFVNECK
jgi:serine/threonine-protein kinase